MSSTKIRAVLILEVLGRPPENLKETLTDLIQRIGEEKGIKVEEKIIHDSNLIKDQKDLYSSYAEVEVSLDEPFLLLLLTFKYMPSHLEIISPENIPLTNAKLGEMVNELTRRLHKYDELARVLQAEKQMLENQIKKLQGNEETGKAPTKKKSIKKVPKKKTSKKK